MLQSHDNARFQRFADPRNFPHILLFDSREVETARHAQQVLELIELCLQHCYMGVVCPLSSEVDYSLSGCTNVKVLGRVGTMDYFTEAENEAMRVFGCFAETTRTLLLTTCSDTSNLACGAGISVVCLEDFVDAIHLRQALEQALGKSTLLVSAT